MKIGCLGILLLVASLATFGWYKTSYLPEKITETVISHTNNYSSKFKDRSDPNFVNYLNREYRDHPGLFCEVKYIQDTEFELCKNSPSNYRDKIENTLSDNECSLNISFPNPLKPFKKIIDLGNYVGINKNSITQSEKYFFVAWKHVNESSRCYSVKVLTLEKSTGKEIAERTVLSKGFGIENLAIGYHPKSNSILFAWNDYNLSSSKDLCLANIGVQDLLNTKKYISYKQILIEDSWDKRNPIFIRDNDKLYLSHSTGDHWGIAAHSGNLSVGVSEINDKLSPSHYSIIFGKTNTGEILNIKNGIIYYTRMSSSGSAIEEIRSIPFKDAFRHSKINEI